MFPVRYAISTAHQVPSPYRSKPEGCWRAPPVGRGNPGQSALPPPQRLLPHTTHFSQRADLPWVYLATMALLNHRPRPMIAESGALVRAIRRAAMAAEIFAEAGRLRRRLDPPVDRLGRRPEDRRTRIATELPELRPYRGLRRLPVAPFLLLQSQVLAAGVLVEARLKHAVELHPQRRSLAGRSLGALLGRIFQPVSGRRTGTAVSGKSGLQEGAGAEPQKFREIGVAQDVI